MRTAFVLAPLFAFVAHASDGLVAHWKFDEGKRKIATDASGNAHDAKIVNAVHLGEGSEKVLHFSARGWVDVGNPKDDSLTFGKERDISVSAWIRVSVSPRDEYVIMGKGDKGTNPKLLLKIMKDNTVLFRLGGGGSVDARGKSAVVDGRWHHVAGVADRDAATRLYIDGQLDGQGGPTNKIQFDSDSSLFIGKSHQKGAGARRYFKGLIDDVRIYDRALADNEIALLAKVSEDRAKIAEPAPPSFPDVAKEPIEKRRDMIALGRGAMVGEATMNSAILQTRLTWGTKLIHGDMLGCPGVARFEVSASPDLTDSVKTLWMAAATDYDFIVKTKIDGLKPATRY